MRILRAAVVLLGATVFGTEMFPKPTYLPKRVPFSRYSGLRNRNEELEVYMGDPLSIRIARKGVYMEENCLDEFSKLRYISKRNLQAIIDGMNYRVCEAPGAPVDTSDFVITHNVVCEEKNKWYRLDCQFQDRANDRPHSTSPAPHQSSVQSARGRGHRVPLA